ncbi:MAG: RNA-guided pseudouridylation complex pseudouridine synthase subunit Cbf5 [Candidatus Woesearchaeota archaeon]
MSAEGNFKLPFERVSRELLVKRESSTDPSLGCSPDERSVNELINFGVINLDKPSGPTSHQVSDYLQRILHIDKAGHSGTLDPKVTGVLPVALGRATRLVHLLLKSGKEYVALMHLHSDVSEEEVRRRLSDFVGRINQKPPLRSAVKRVFRERNIYYIEVIEVDGRDVLFKIGCEAGTYIRKFIYDFGQSTGWRASMSELRRTRVAHFDESSIHTLQDVADAYWYWREEGREDLIRKIVLPAERILECIPKVYVLDSAVDSLCHGANLNVPGVSKLDSEISAGDIVGVMTLKGEVVAYGIAKMSSQEILSAEKGFAVKVEKVFMQPGTYKIS